MKKTLITLMALSSVAMAATDGYLYTNPDALTWDDALTLTNPADGVLTSSNAGLAWSETAAELQSWELSFILKVKELKDGNKNEIFGTNGSSSSGAYGTVLNIDTDGSIYVSPGREASVLRSAAGGVQIGDGVGGYGEGVAITLTYVSYVHEITKVSEGGLLTLKVGDAAAQSVEFKIAAENATLYNGANKNSRFFTNGARQTMSDITVKAGGVMYIPEPATATLSLLALAGLAARRRRK